MKNTTNCFLLAAVSSVALCGSAVADIAAIGSSRDNTLYQDPEGDLSNGAGNGMFSGRSGAASNSIRRGLIRFDIAGQIPAGATITSATLTLYNSAANAGEAMVSLHRVSQDWGEGTSVAGMGGGGGAAATPGDATWLFRSFPGTAWATAGGSFDPATSAVTSVTETGSYDWASAALNADIQSFLDSPAANFGWIILGDESASSTAKRFATKEETLAELRPMLMVEYTPVPSPGAVGLLALGAAATACRRRHP